MARWAAGRTTRLVESPLGKSGRTMKSVLLGPVCTQPLWPERKSSFAYRRQETPFTPHLFWPVHGDCRLGRGCKHTITRDSRTADIAGILKSCYPVRGTHRPFVGLPRPPNLLPKRPYPPSSLQLNRNRSRGQVHWISPSRNGQGSSPWPKRPRSLARTLPDRRQMRRTRQRPAARSSNRRSGPPGWQST